MILSFSHCHQQWNVDSAFSPVVLETPDQSAHWLVYVVPLLKVTVNTAGSTCWIESQRTEWKL